MPSLVPLVASVVLWKWLLNTDFGIVNQALRELGVANPPGGSPTDVGDPVADHHASVGRDRRYADDHLPGRACRAFPNRCTTPRPLTAPTPGRRRCT